MSIEGFDYIRNMQKFFRPRTPHTAFKAAEEGLLPPEAFIYSATSIEPVIDNPDNLNEIERILGQQELDLETNLLLINVLVSFLKDPDKEKALFAAESINSIENRYNRALENLPPDSHARRAQIYTEMAELNRAAPDLRNFYLREAFSAYRVLERDDSIKEEGRLNMCRLLIELGLLAQAEKIITDNRIKGPDAGFILADIAFRQRNYAELFDILRDLNENCRNMDSRQRELVTYWLGSE